MTWEHPVNRSRRLDRTAFTQATQNKLPENIVNKIFSYKEAMNYLRNKYQNKIGNSKLSPHSRSVMNEKLNRYTRWLANSNSGITTPAKLTAIHKSMTTMGSGESKMYNRYITKIKTKNHVNDLRRYITAARKSKFAGFKSYKMASDFLKQNSKTRNEVINAINRGVHQYQIIGMIGNRDDMLNILKRDINKEIFRKQQTIRNHEYNIAKLSKKPSKKQTSKRSRAMIEIENLKKHVNSLQNQKRKLENMTTATLKNKIKNRSSNN